MEKENNVNSVSVGDMDNQMKPNNYIPFLFLLIMFFFHILAFLVHKRKRRSKYLPYFYKQRNTNIHMVKLNRKVTGYISFEHSLKVTFPLT